MAYTFDLKRTRNKRLQTTRSWWSIHYNSSKETLNSSLQNVYRYTRFVTLNAILLKPCNIHANIVQFSQKQVIVIYLWASSLTVMDSPRAFSKWYVLMAPISQRSAPNNKRLDGTSTVLNNFNMFRSHVCPFFELNLVSQFLLGLSNTNLSPIARLWYSTFVLLTQLSLLLSS